MWDVFDVDYHMGDDAEYLHLVARFTTEQKMRDWMRGHYWQQRWNYWTENPADRRFPNGSGPKLKVQYVEVPLDPQRSK
jgi:hypothetical protein